MIAGSLAVVLRTALLDNFLLSYDEAIHLVWLRLLAAGYQPYTEVYITYPPLYPLSIQAIWSLWPTEAAQRWFSVAYAIFGAIGVALLARKIAGAAAGVAAAVLILFSPILVEPSRAVLAEFPSVAWSVWAIWFILLYQEATTTPRRYVFLMVAGLCAAASLMTKLLSPFLIVLILLLIAANHRDQIFSRPAQFRPFLTEVALWGLAVVLPILTLVFLVFDVGPIVQQVISQRLMARNAYIADSSTLPPTYEYIVTFVTEDTALVVLGCAGIVLTWVKQRTYFGLMVGWLLLAVAFLTIHHPLRYKHFLVFLPILAIFSGIAIAQGISLLARRKLAVYTIVGLILLIFIYFWQIPTTLTRWEAQASMAHPPSDEVEMLAFIDDVIAPDDCLITDDMPLLYWSERMTPPEFAEMSANRLISGALSLEEVIAVSDQHDCQVVAAIANRLPKYLPDYMTWVKANYLGQIRYGEDDLFFAKKDTTPQPKVSLWADFNGKLAFHGYSLPDRPIFPGERFPLKLIWQAQTKMDTDYAIFVQLRDSQGTTLASADYQPYKGLVPFSKWPLGATIQTMTWLELPADILPADYNIYVGLYNPNNSERLPLGGDTSGENALTLGPVRVR